jgi:DNA-directed RNA polymerase specialized sigma24 family protein
MRKHLCLEAALERARGWATVKGRPSESTQRLTPERGGQANICTAERQEILEIMARELARLPQHEKEAVEAKSGVSGDSCRTIARRRGVCAQTVCNWAKSGFAKLRPQLEGCL